MNSIKYADLDPNNNTTSDRIFKTSLSLLLIVLVSTMAPSYYFFSFIKPAMAADLTNIVVLPTSSLTGQRTTWDFIFKTATPGEIKTIEMQFTPDFDISKATKLIERSGIGPGSLSLSSTPTGPRLIYTVTNQASIPAGTTIRLEIGTIVALTDGSQIVGIKTKNISGGTIDGLTNSEVILSSVGSSDVSPSFIVRKTLNDDDAGHAHGWDPNGSTKSFAIFDSDILGASDSEFISVMIRYTNLAYCTASPGDTGLFVVHCNSAPVDSAVLDYIITKLPANVVTSTDTSAFTSSSPLSSASSQDIASFARHDDIASEFP